MPRRHAGRSRRPWHAPPPPQPVPASAMAASSATTSATRLAGGGDEPRRAVVTCRRGGRADTGGLRRPGARVRWPCWTSTTFPSPDDGVVDGVVDGVESPPMFGQLLDECAAAFASMTAAGSVEVDFAESEELVAAWATAPP